MNPWLYWLPSSIKSLKLGQTIFYRDFPVKKLSGMKAALLGRLTAKLSEQNAARRQNADFFIKELGLDNRSGLSYIRLPIMAESLAQRNALYHASNGLGLGLSLMYPKPVNGIEELAGYFNFRDVFPAGGLKGLSPYPLIRLLHGKTVSTSLPFSRRLRRADYSNRESLTAMKLIITIDTEEDEWGKYSVAGHSVENIKKVPALQRLFDEFNVKPTYLVAHTVCEDDSAVEILNGIMDKGGCEIGAHCHPWNTPPFEEELTVYNSMLCNLPPRLQYLKMQSLDETIKKKFGVKPVSFRCGRWGYSSEVAENLLKLGYKVDTSIASYTDWSEYNGPDFSSTPPLAYRFDAKEILTARPSGALVEVPATVGFLQRRFSFTNSIIKAVSRPPLSTLRLKGLLWRLNLVNKVWLSPEYHNAATMIRLVRRMKENNLGFLNMTFHSPCLVPELTPFVRTAEDARAFISNIREFLSFTQDEGIESIKLSEATRHI